MSFLKVQMYLYIERKKIEITIYKKQIKIMEALFITWLVLAGIYMIGWSALITDLLLQFVKGIQNKIHNWANQ